MSAQQLEHSELRAWNHCDCRPLALPKVWNELPGQRKPQDVSPQWVPKFVAVEHEFTYAAWLTSQPLASLLSQLSKPPLHDAIWQLPVAQVALALARVQGTPQPPQLLFVLSGVSQPLLGLPSQLWKPPLQLGEHPLLTQPVLPLLLVHCVVQLPQ
jgi:hypothetical protein